MSPLMKKLFAIRVINCKNWLIPNYLNYKEATNEDDTLMHRTLLYVEIIVSKQIKGLPMGSPISLVVSEITMQCVEKSIFSNDNFHLNFGKDMWMTVL